MRKGYCSICERSDVSEINFALASGPRMVTPAAKAFGTGRTALINHMRHSALTLDVDHMEFFHRAISRCAPTRCIEWPFSTAAQMGYGQVSSRGVKSYVHRLAFELYVGPIPDGFVVCHRCDNPLCFNPHHLFTGTLGDNNRDTASKGRSCIGTRNGAAKLTDADVAEIRRLYRFGVKGFGQYEIGKRFGITRIAVRKIVKRQTWNHVASL